MASHQIEELTVLAARELPWLSRQWGKKNLEKLRRVIELAIEEMPRSPAGYLNQNNQCQERRANLSLEITRRIVGELREDFSLGIETLLIIVIAEIVKWVIKKWLAGDLPQSR
jgi:hypothetical protein